MTVHKIATEHELNNGEFKEIKIGRAKILLVRHQDRYYALGGECPHRGAPLADGSVHDIHVRCPWHQAVFDITSGDLEEPCSLDSVTGLRAWVEGGEVRVEIPEKLRNSRVPPMVQPDPERDNRTFVIVGAGGAGLAAAETLRADGYAGRIVMVTREDSMPYDRTELSKGYLGDPDAKEPWIRSAKFYENHGIEVLTGHEVTRLDPKSKTVEFANGQTLTYDRVLLATGSTPRRLGAKGEDLDGVFVLRSLGDCQRIKERLKTASAAIVVGASFIGMESAAWLTDHGVSVTIIAPNSVPFESTLGGEIGKMYQRVHEEKGVTFKLRRKVERFERGSRGGIAAVLDGGERLEADIVVVGVGVVPNTGYLEGMKLNDDGSIPVDKHLQAWDDVYAAGDIASLPHWETGEPIRIEHWRFALQLGRLAAHNMAGRDTEYRGVPFFWTNQYWVITKYVGYAKRWDDIVFDGDPSEGEFVAYYLRDGKVVASAGAEQDLEMCVIADIMKARGSMELDEMRRLVTKHSRSFGGSQPAP